MKVLFEKIVSEAQIPERATNSANGFDVYACRVLNKNSRDHEQIADLPLELMPGQIVLIGSGVRMMIPDGYDCQVRSRSGLAAKHSVTLANCLGTVDPDFRGEVGVLLINDGTESFIIEAGMRIAQLAFTEIIIPEVEVVDFLPPSLRANGGFGSTGFWGISEGTAEGQKRRYQLDLYFMRLAVATSMMSNCVRGCAKGPDGKFLRDEKGSLIGQTRRFGCVIVKDGSPIATGCNIQAPGQLLCSEVGCLREAQGIRSGTHVEICRGIHAEEMAMGNLLRSGGTSIKGATMIVTAEPCQNCSRMIAGLGIDHLVILEGQYPLNGIAIVNAAGVAVRYVKKEDL